MAEKILVYVQALPVSIPASAKKFSDLESAEFRMSHSSKMALAAAASLDTDHKIIAAGFSPILREAVSRGASFVYPMPLCDDPLNQFSFFPKDQNFSTIFVGENPDWVFSGASLAGFLSSKLGYRLDVFDGSSKIKEPRSVILVLDSGNSAPGIDIRRIDPSMDTAINPEGVLGDAVIRKMEETKPEVLSGSLENSVATISRRLRRITRSGWV